MVIRAEDEFVIPEAISPNSDGFNDTFMIGGLGFYKENSITIFNRWGDAIFVSSPYENNWNGQSNVGQVVSGEQVIDGTYFYILKLQKNREELIYKGYIELRR